MTWAKSAAKSHSLEIFTKPMSVSRDSVIATNEQSQGRRYSVHGVSWRSCLWTLYSLEADPVINPYSLITEPLESRDSVKQR
jgi:hypothetical protein